MSYLDDLATARDQIAANIKAMTVNPMPNYNIDGQNVSWGDLLDKYMTQLNALNVQINGAEPFEFESQGLT